MALANTIVAVVVLNSAVTTWRYLDNRLDSCDILTGSFEVTVSIASRLEHILQSALPPHLRIECVD